MKNLLFAIMLLFATTANSKNDVTKFLGIPVDGTKNAMIDKLIDKGFTYNREEDYLEGEFNGQDVHLNVVTNNNKVYRIMVTETTKWNETDIRIRFNTLFNQFNNNPRYLCLNEKSLIPEEEKIAYEMEINNKRYEADFFQEISFDNIDTIAIKEKAKELLKKSSSDDDIYYSSGKTEKVDNAYKLMLLYHVYENAKNKLVWFIINKFLDKYYIVIYYDNLYNRANGEDL